MAALVIFMAANDCFTNKTFSCSNVKKKQVLVSEASFANRKSLLFEISRYLFASHEVWFVIIFNQYALSYLIINL